MIERNTNTQEGQTRPNTEFDEWFIQGWGWAARWQNFLMVSASSSLLSQLSSFAVFSELSLDLFDGLFRLSEFIKFCKVISFDKVSIYVYYIYIIIVSRREKLFKNEDMKNQVCNQIERTTIMPRLHQKDTIEQNNHTIYFIDSLLHAVTPRGVFVSLQMSITTGRLKPGRVLKKEAAFTITVSVPFALYVWPPDS